MLRLSPFKTSSPFFTSIILTLALCATAIVPTYAAEKTEPTQGDVSSTYSTVWGPGVHDGGDYTFTDTNLTPEKVMGASGRFAISDKSSL